MMLVSRCCTSSAARTPVVAFKSHTITAEFWDSPELTMLVLWPQGPYNPCSWYMFDTTMDHAWTTSSSLWLPRLSISHFSVRFLSSINGLNVCGMGILVCLITRVLFCFSNSLLRFLFVSNLLFTTFTVIQSILKSLFCFIPQLPCKYLV